MQVKISFNCAKALEAGRFVTLREISHLKNGSVRFGVCSVDRIPLRDSNLFLYGNSIEQTFGVAESLNAWINSGLSQLDDWIEIAWNDPAGGFPIVDKF